MTGGGVERKSESGERVRSGPWLDRNGWVLFVITLLCFTPFAFFSVDLHHDGVMLKPAMDVAAGRVLFRDSFNQYGFLTTFLQAAVVRIFGGELLAIKLLTVVFYGLCAVELDRFWRRFLSVPFRWLMMILFWGMAPLYLLPMHPWSSVYALYFMLLTGTFTVRYLDSGDRKLLFGSGVAAGLAFGCRQPCGFVLVIAAVMTLALEAWVRRTPWRGMLRKGAVWCAGALVIPAILAFYLTFCGAWPDYLQQCFVAVGRFGWERGGGGAFESILLAFFPAEGFIVFPLLSLGLFFYACSALVRRDEVRLYLPLAAAVLIGLASWHQFFPVPCIRHLYWGSVPMMGAAAYVAERIWRSRWRRIVRVALLAGVLILPGLEIGYRMFGAVMRIAYLSEREWSDLPGTRGMLMFPGEINYLRNMAIVLAQIPEPFRERPCLNMTEQAMFCRLLPDQPPVHPMYVDWGRAVYPDYPEVMMEFVREHRPVILSRKPEPFPGYRPIGGFPLVKPVYYLSLPPF